MANSIAKLAILLTTDASGVSKGFAQATASVQQFSSSLGSMAAQLGLIGGGVGAAGFLGWGVKLAADAETAGVAFHVMLGDADKAKQLLGDINAMALNTNLGGAGLRQSAQTLIGFGVAGENIMPVMQMLGDISLGNQDKFNSLALAFGQMSSAGRLMGQDLLQMINVGFNPLTEISRKTGESMADLKKRMEAGAISTREVVEAFQSATAEGGKYHNMLNEMSGTLSARWAKLQEEVGVLAMKLGEQLMPALKSILALGSDMVSWLGTISRSTMVWVGSIGAAIFLAPKIVGAIKAIVGGFRALATAQAMQQALMGPAGWGTLAAGLAIAAGAALTINAAFDSANESLAQHSIEAKKAADAAQKLNLEAFTGAAPKKDEASDAAARQMEALQKHGEQLTQSLRTPFERIKDDLAAAMNLLNAGAISAETYARAQGKAREDLAAQAESADQIRNRLQAQNRPVAAMQYGTNAAFSALNAASAEQKIQAELQKQMVAQQKDTNDKLRRIENAIKGKETVTVNEVTL